MSPLHLGDNHFYWFCFVLIHSPIHFTPKISHTTSPIRIDNTLSSLPMESLTHTHIKLVSKLYFGLMLSDSFLLSIFTQSWKILFQEIWLWSRHKTKGMFMPLSNLKDKWSISLNALSNRQDVSMNDADTTTLILLTTLIMVLVLLEETLVI